MEYEVFVEYGEDRTGLSKVQGVKEINFFDESYYFYDSEGNVLFISPQKNVIYIKKQ